MTCAPDIRLDEHERFRRIRAGATVSKGAPSTSSLTLELGEAEWQRISAGGGECSF
jgi:hypothetical protein